jgi:lipopolysaccharide/colanic/teichoic acid biosynthesis glycosyltransferase
MERGYVSRFYRGYGKRAVDCCVSSLALVLLSPLLIIISIMVRSRLGSPVLFRQPRPGLNGRTFVILKFRTMTDTRDRNGELLPNALRVTRIGRILRASSLDELPGLWNVLRGDMSLVGPRPLLCEYLPYYSAQQRRRHSVRPGITGLAQVSGRNHTTWEQRLAQDVLYVDNCTLWLDCKIIARTLIALPRGDGGVDAISKLGRFRGCGEAAPGMRR